jgi:hypothetical protein
MILKMFSPKKLTKKIGVFCSNYCKLLQKFDHDIGFREKKRHFFRRKLTKNAENWQKHRKLAKIAKNCDHTPTPGYFPHETYPEWKAKER